MTLQSAASVLGNLELAQQLIAQEGSRIEVIAQLNRDPDTVSKALLNTGMNSGWNRNIPEAKVME